MMAGIVGTDKARVATKKNIAIWVAYLQSKLTMGPIVDMSRENAEDLIATLENCAAFLPEDKP